MDDLPLRDDSGGQEEFIYEDEDERSSWRKIVIITIIILLLLLLFWPVSPKRLREEQARTGRGKDQLLGPRAVGKAKYRVISGGPLEGIGGNSRKAAAVGVWFEVENISSKAEVLDYSLVSIRDSFDRQYVNHPGLINEWYSKNGVKSPWEKPVPPGGKVKALGVFFAFRGDKKLYILEGRDFAWISGKVEDYAIGTFSTKR